MQILELINKEESEKIEKKLEELEEKEEKVHKKISKKIMNEEKYIGLTEEQL
jgi:hypothetical protein